MARVICAAGCASGAIRSSRRSHCTWVGERAGLAYPDTYFLFLHAAVLRDVMARYHVDARIYRAAPPATQATLARIGLGSGVFLKDHATFFDTLQLVVAIALAEGRQCQYLRGVGRDAIAHVGGTSWKTAETKELIDSCTDWRFLDFDDDAELRQRYRRRTRPFRFAADVRAAIAMTLEAFARLALVDDRVRRLAERRAAGDATPAAGRRAMAP